MAEHELARQAERDAELAHFVLEELSQRLEQLEMQRFRQPAHVVVRLDRMRFLRLGSGRFDHVGIDRSLREPSGAGDFLRLGLEDVHELAPDDLALLLRVGHAGERSQERVARVHAVDLDAEMPRERVHDLIGFAQSQQARIDEDAGEFVADRAMDERRGDRGIDAARQPENHRIGVDFRANPGDRLTGVTRHCPVAGTAADILDEARKNRLALERMRDLGVELHAIEAPRFIHHRRDRRRGVGRHDREARRQSSDFVAVTHPDIEQPVSFGVGAILDAGEKAAVALRTHFRVTELANLPAFHAAAQLRRHRLHAVTDAQHRNARIPRRVRRARRIAFGHALGPPRQDDPRGREVADERIADVVGMDLAIHVQLADAARDELRVLGTEIEDQYLAMHVRGIKPGARRVGTQSGVLPRRAQRPGGRRSRRRSRRPSSRTAADG